MKTKLHRLAIALLLLSTLNFQLSTCFAQGTTAFTNQGQLKDNGTNANGTYTMIFKLYDAVSAGNQVGGGIANSGIALANGLFSVNLDFGSVFTGGARWLDITITNGGFTQTLSPRVQVLPTPYAQFAAVAATVTNGAIMNAQLAANAVNTTNIQNNTITTAQLASGAVTNRNLTANAVNATNIAGGQVVKSLNGLADNTALSAGANVSLFTNGNSLQISAGVPNIQIFRTNGTFIVPTNVTRIMVEMWGGGGGGGSGVGGFNDNLDGGSAGAGAGGGGGGYGKDVFNVTPGGNLSVTVGNGGVGGVNGSIATSGGTSSLGGLISTTGGNAGQSAVFGSNNSPNGGSGGFSTVADNISGDAGHAGQVGCGCSVAGNGGAAADGSGGMANSGGSGSPGKGPGGGGAGGSPNAPDVHGPVYSSNTDGGSGANGRVIVYY